MKQAWLSVIYSYSKRHQYILYNQVWFGIAPELHLRVLVRVSLCVRVCVPVSVCVCVCVFLHDNSKRNDLGT